MHVIPKGAKLTKVLAWCEERGASDLHIQSGRPHVARVDGALVRVDPAALKPWAGEELYTVLGEAFSPEAVTAIRRRNEFDLSFHHGPNRYRAH